MNDQEHGRSADEDPKSDGEQAAAYESLAVVRLGPVDQLTTQNGSGNGQTQ